MLGTDQRSCVGEYHKGVGVGMLDGYGGGMGGLVKPLQYDNARNIIVMVMELSVSGT